MEENFFQTLFLTLKLASLTTAILFAVSFPIAFYLSRSQGILKSMLEIIVTLPLVLPPTVIGFYLLLLLSPEGYIGFIFNELFDVQLIFSFTGLVVGSIIFLPKIFTQFAIILLVSREKSSEPNYKALLELLNMFANTK